MTLTMFLGGGGFLLLLIAQVADHFMPRKDDPQPDRRN